MSIRGRSILGAILLFGGFLILLGAGVYKSSDRIRYERNVERQRGDQSPPSRGGPNVLMILGGLVSVGGAVVIGLAIRDMVAQIGAASAGAEQRLQRELMNPKQAKPKPPT